MTWIVGFWSGASGGGRKHNKIAQHHTGGKGANSDSEATVCDSAACPTLQASPRRSDGDPRGEGRDLIVPAGDGNP